MRPHTSIGLTGDNFTIWIGLAGAVCAFLAYLILGFVRHGKRKDTALGAFARGSYYGCVGALAAACIYLLQCILSGNRFDLAYVYENSAPRDGLLYQISALWAGQGGSLLLWALMGGVIGVFLLRKMERSAPWLASFWSLIQVFFLVVMVVDDPLKKLEGFQAGMMGSGLNPLLKNPWMAIHPPVIFLGYALLAVPAAFAVHALVSGDASKLAKRCLPWALAGWVAMTVGLVLGMVWSYEVLGWGGYWGWDPVENASLVPWLLSTALVHGLVLQRNRHIAALWNVILAFLTFLSVMYATFLTRSGVLSDVSVHSFGKTPAFGVLMGFPILFGAICLALLTARGRNLKETGEPMRARSRSFVLGLGIVVLCLFAVVVLVGTSYTTFCRGAAIEPGFYTRMSIPLALAALVLVGLSPMLKWRGGASTADPPLTIALGAMAAVVAVAIVGCLLAVVAPGFVSRALSGVLPVAVRNSGVAVAAMIGLLGLGIVALIINARGVAGSTLGRCGVYLAHAGVALVVIGVVTSTFGRSEVLDLTSGGTPAEAFGYRFSYEGRTRVADDFEVLHVVAERWGEKIFFPLKLVESERGKTMFPHISSGVLRDLYVAPDSVTGKVVTPMVAMTDKGWMSEPAVISGTDARLALEGMQVESDLATLIYMKPGAEPVRFEISKGHPKTVDGYTFSFDGFVSNGAKNMAQVSAGVKVGVSGGGFADSATIRVSEKPLISLLWLGTVLICGGGVIAMVRRRREKAE